MTKKGVFLFTRIDRNDRENVTIDVRHSQLAGKKNIRSRVSLIFTSPERSSFDYQERIFFANRKTFEPFSALSLLVIFSLSYLKESLCRSLRVENKN